jgi:hypothetical protein
MIDAMKQALYLIDGWQRGAYAEEYPNEIAALRQAIEESTNSTKPVVESDKDWNGWLKRDVYFEDGEPLMHSEPEWVGLTDEEILNLYTSITKSAWDCIMYARVIEARLKGMNHEPRQYKDLCGND